MRIGIVSDIHGNAAALVQVLRVARIKKIERFFVLGDIIGYYYDAQAVMCLLSGWKFDAVSGNHERLLSRSIADTEFAAEYRRRYGSSLDVARETLSGTDINWLIGLPDRAHIDFEGLRFELCHGSPLDSDQYVYPDASEEIFSSCRIEKRDFVLMGHTHYPFINPRLKPTLLNPGSVGQARDQGGVACWCHIDTDTCSVVFERTPYDPASLMEEARRRDPHLPYLVNILARHRSLPTNSGMTV